MEYEFVIDGSVLKKFKKNIDDTLEVVEIPTGVEKIDRGSFIYCKKLKNVVIPITPV